MCVRNKKQFLITFYAIFITIAFIVFVLYVRALQDFHTYIGSKFGNKCYIEGQENENIKYPMKFNNLQDCLDYIND